MIALLKERLVPVANNDWYNRRRDDPTGEFFRSVADQGPRKGEGGSTRQGHYIFTASGKLLGYNNNRSLDRKLAFVRDALEAWDTLPAEEREPGAVVVPAPGAGDPRYTASPPEGGLVLNTFTRVLKPAAGTPTRLAPCEDDEIGHPGGHFSALDHVWVQPGEWEALVGLAASGGGPVPEPLAYRILRFHLVDNTRGEPPFWKRDEVREFSFEVVPSGDPRRFELRGHALLSTAENPESAERGYDVALEGVVELGADGTTPQRFDLVALGPHWGAGPYTLEARPGRTPLGVAFELAMRDKPSDEIRPQASTHLRGYWRADTE